MLRVKHDLIPNLRLDKLIKIAEDTGMIIPLGEEILRRACWQCRQCLDNGHNLIVAVNLSIRQLEQESIVETVFDALKEANLPPEHLALEVTETSLMENFSSVNERLARFRNAGIHISLDDFGTGYSSMEYIKELAIDKIKIDVGFVRDINTDDKSVEIVRGITLLAKTLGLKVCAEGVEKEEQFLKLRDIGVDQVQGYLFGRPMPAMDLQKYLTDKKSR